MQLLVDEAEASAKSRLTAIRSAILLTRSMEVWRRGRMDPETVLIILAVIAITSEKFTRAGLDEDYRALDVYLPLEQLQSCNVASIAAATGLNRETARRRVEALIKSGSLIRTGAGDIALPPDKVQERSALQLVRKQLDAVVRFANESLRDGVLLPVP
ncbi:MAG: hypothetical protein QOH04_2089 [Sphingomonadales bacterium]|jgi:hypothetical protein|nr:hypothetical protein [Sphingomonadales bacterium]MEA3036324.1 hypothetical protein [Sphingomonadales bacterium]